MGLVLLSQFSTRKPSEYIYEVYSHPSCNNCPKKADLAYLAERGYEVVYFPNGSVETPLYPVFRVRYGDTAIASTVGYLPKEGIADFFLKSYLAHWLEANHKIESKDMTLSQLISVHSAIVRLLK